MNSSAFSNSLARSGIGRFACCAPIVLLLFAQLLQGQSATVVNEPTTTIHVTTQIVLLDVDVVDKKGRPVSSIFNRDDFTITEDGKPQQLIAFEPPVARSAEARSVFVLDELNTDAADKAYYLVCFEKYLSSLPETLTTPTELMVLTASSLKIAQPYTRNRGELLATLAHLPVDEALTLNIQPDRFSRTLTALEEVALESLGDPGRTAVVWLGPGEGIDLDSQYVTMRSQTERYIRYLTNTLLESRTTLYVIFPPDFFEEFSSLQKTQDQRDVSSADPYSGAINFRTLAAQTGGAAYMATNDLTAAMRDALDLGRKSYMLGYRPADTVTDGKFRRVRVTLRNSNLRVVTKSGYYAPDVSEQDAPQTLQVFQMTEAGRSRLSFDGLPFHIDHIERAPDGRSIEFTLSADGKDLPWRPEGQDQSLSELTAGGVSFSKQGKKLAASFENVSVMARTQTPSTLKKTTASFKVNVTVPADADRVRLVVSSRSNGRLGCVDVAAAAINNATANARKETAGP